MLADSPYTYVYEDSSKITLYFSSKFNLIRFKSKYEGFNSYYEKKINRLSKQNIDLTLPMIITLYESVENRGFLVQIDNEFYYENNIDFSCEVK